MRYLTILLGACVVLASAGCGPPAERADEPVRQPREVAERAPASPDAQRPQLMLDGRGLIVTDAQGVRRTIAFDGPASAALTAARAIYGEPAKVEALEECGAGPLQVSLFPGLTLAAQGGKFVGWWLTDDPKPPSPSTAQGIGIGSTRAALEKTYAIEAYESSLGHEFVAGGISGLTDGPGKLAKITHLWAGATCTMR